MNPLCSLVSIRGYEGLRLLFETTDRRGHTLIFNGEI